MDEGFADSAIEDSLVYLLDEDLDNLFINAIDPTKAIESFTNLEEHDIESGDAGRVH